MTDAIFDGFPLLSQTRAIRAEGQGAVLQEWYPLAQEPEHVIAPMPVRSEDGDGITRLKGSDLEQRSDGYTVPAHSCPSIGALTSLESFGGSRARAAKRRFMKRKRVSQATTEAARPVVFSETPCRGCGKGSSTRRRRRFDDGRGECVEPHGDGICNTPLQGL